MPVREKLKKMENEPGLFFIKHETRKHGANNSDRQWVLRQTLGGVTRVSVLGWESEGVKKGDAINKRDEFKSNHKWNSQNPIQPKKPICIANEKASQAVAAEDNPTFTEFIKRFTRHHFKNISPTTAQEYTRQIEKHFLPAWGKRELRDIKRKHIIKLVEHISDKAPVMGNRTLSAIKKIFSYAVEVEFIETNPAAGIKPLKETKKDRVLDLQEIVTLFGTLDNNPDRDLRDILKLIAATALRPGEVRTMRLAQLKDRWLELSGSDTKTGQAHRVFLNDIAIDIIESRKKDLHIDDYLFPSTSSYGFIIKDVLSRKVRRLQPIIDIEKFTAHDLRRSAATGLARLGYGALVPDILNHSQRGITRQVYDKYNREPEKERALTSWGEAIQRAIDGTQAEIISING